MEAFISIGVRNMAESLHFYCDFLNFDLERMINPEPNVELAWLSNNKNMKIELIHRNAEYPFDNQKSSVIISLVVEDLKEYTEWLEDQEMDYTEKQLPNGIETIRFTDPNEIPVALIQLNKTNNLETEAPSHDNVPKNETV